MSFAVYLMIIMVMLTMFGTWNPVFATIRDYVWLTIGMIFFVFLVIYHTLDKIGYFIKKK